MIDAPAPSLITANRPGRLGSMIGRFLSVIYKLIGRDRYDDYKVERVVGMPILVIPTVANPKVLRTGAFFASQLDGERIGPGAEVLDLGTGSGICALVAARHARRVVATDINAAAVRCAHVNAQINGLEDRIELRHGDLFSPVAGERFDLVLFNPPFLSGVPRDDRDAAWRSDDLANRFAAELSDHLKPDGEALLLLSSFGNKCARYESELVRQLFRLEVFAQRRYVNEIVTILRATPSSVAEKTA